MTGYAQQETFLPLSPSPPLRHPDLPRAESHRNVQRSCSATGSVPTPALPQGSRSADTHPLRWQHRVLKCTVPAESAAPTERVIQRSSGIGGSTWAGKRRHRLLPVPARCQTCSQLNFGEKKIPRFHGNRRRKVSGAAAGIAPAWGGSGTPAPPSPPSILGQGWCLAASPTARAPRGAHPGGMCAGAPRLPLPSCVRRDLTFSSAARCVEMQR